MRKGFIFSLLLAVAASPAIAAPGDYAAAVAFSGRPATEVAKDAGRKPADILDFMQLRPGMKVIDVVTGTGYYAEIMARAVGAKGTVVAFQPKAFYDDGDKAALDGVAKREANFSLTTDFRAAMTPATYDFAMIHLNYHDFYWTSEKNHVPRVDPDVVLWALYKAMKPGGIVSVIDHVGPAGDTRALVDKLHRIDPEVVKVDFKRAGFVLEAESNLLRMPSDDHSKPVFDPSVRGKTDRFVFRFRKPLG